jgi:hypothetical protein
MHRSPSLLILFIVALAACSSRSGAPRDPGSPTPVAGPEPATATPPHAPPTRGETGGSDPRRVPTRAEQAPLVPIRDALEADSLLGRRVRVAGRCTGAGVGRRLGSWTLSGSDAAIEVRGRVPPSCSADNGEDLTIFAQIEPKSTGSPDRLLLRLPD